MIICKHIYIYIYIYNTYTCTQLCNYMLLSLVLSYLWFAYISILLRTWTGTSSSARRSSTPWRGSWGHLRKTGELARCCIFLLRRWNSTAYERQESWRNAADLSARHLRMTYGSDAEWAQQYRKFCAEREKPAVDADGLKAFVEGGPRKSTNGVGTNGVAAVFLGFFRWRDFLGTPVSLLLSSQKCQGVLFSPTRQNYH